MANNGDIFENPYFRKTKLAIDRAWELAVKSKHAETLAWITPLHDLYRELPSRLSADSLKLDQLSYADSTRDGSALVRFQLSFGIPSAKVK